MKKLSLLIAMILCVTIGGVYATWVYTGDENVADVSEPITINLEDPANGGAHGTYTLKKDLNGAETFIRIDDTNNDHIAELVCRGTIRIEFTPAPLAPDEIKNGEFDSWVYFTTNIDTLTFDGQKIFEDFTHTDKDTGIKITWTVQDGKLVCDLTDYLIDEINLATSIKLDSLADYNRFATAIEFAKINVHVTDGIVAE